MGGLVKETKNPAYSQVLSKAVEKRKGPAVKPPKPRPKKKQTAETVEQQTVTSKDVRTEKAHTCLWTCL